MTAASASVPASLPADLDPAKPVLIAGPTASGKSALALAIAEAQGGVIVNADAIQVYENWRILTARPMPQDEARVPHRLYGHVAGDAAYSVGDWLRAVSALLAGPERLVIVGGTGLYFAALTEGLAEIPEIAPEIRAEGADRLARDGLAGLLAALDAESRARIDPANPARVLRAWEVLRGTGRGIASWQDATPPPLLQGGSAERLLFEAPKDWLTPRIDRRFDAMLRAGALDEARANLPGWDPGAPSSKAIGAADLVAHLQGRISLEEATRRATIRTRQFAKRQRTWFRARMAGWTVISPQVAA